MDVQVTVRHPVGGAASRLHPLFVHAFHDADGYADQVSTQDGARVVVLTALQVEYRAVRSHVQNRVRRSHPRGTQFEVGVLPGAGGRVAIAQLGQGNIDAALAVGHTVELFRPDAILFVGIAGALHDDLQIGDVIVATKVYAYQGGMETDAGLLARPGAHDADHELLQLAQMAAQDHHDLPQAPPVHFRAVAAGDVVLNSRKRPLAKQLASHYNDAGAIEMESAGMARACHVCRVPALVVRGISDRADGEKETVDAGGSQPLAARNAADFAVAVIRDYLSQPHQASATPAGQSPAIQNIIGAGAPAFGALHGNVYLHPPQEPLVPDWRTLSRPPPVPWRERPAYSIERASLELHLIPVGEVPRIEARGLPGIADTLARLLPPAVRAKPSVSEQEATAIATGYENVPTGLRVSRDGVRSAWQPLPSDMLGSVFDEAWVTRTFATMLNVLSGLALPRATRYAPAVGISQAKSVTVDAVEKLPRRQAGGFGFKDTVQVAAEDSLPADHLGQFTDDVAAELTARLAAVLRRS